ncbi:methyltransferase regulatory domain-containing protein [Haemophilus haemoglobinophilus]|nr:methyltransferase regulatory domain-containing protein [Canicola haemoglobinophilus]MBN6712036.1 methyltransferase regulatory domain-containing protein [Canicola haemoglobinophilus]
MKGLDPAPLETAKVLEIGCSFGGNLLPFAIRHPNSQLVGIDLSEYQINIGQQMMEQVGVKNVELVAADISNVGFNIQFDYIICHGVFSWVPEVVRQAILKTIQDYLSPNGIAYISYNTYPGWKIKDIAKELMLFGSNPDLSRTERVDQSFETLKFVSNIFQRKNAELYKVLSDSFKEVTEQSKYYVAHEHFEEFNHPFYFREFITQIQQYNLAYLTDSSTPVIYRNIHFENDEYDKVCEYFGYHLEAIEQFIDFLNNKTFRGSIITHKQNLTDKGITNNINEYNQCHHFYDLYFRTYVHYSPANKEKEAFWNLVELGVELPDTPLNNVLFNYLQQQNKPCKIGDIFEHVKQYPEYNETELQNLIWSIIHSARVYLCFSPEKFDTYDKKPKLFEPYRKFIDLVKHNPDITQLSNRYYQIINLDFLSQHIAQYLDGTRSIKALIKQIRQDIDDEAIVIRDAQENKLSNKDVKEKEIKELIIERLELFKEYGYFTEY